jgi:uncharacterized membrane protein
MRKDVVIAEIGAAAALAGFVLVFLGILITTYQSLLGRIAAEKLVAFRTAARLAVGVFLLGLTSVAVSTAWLVAGGGKAFYVATIVVFAAELLALVEIAVYATWRVLLR